MSSETFRGQPFFVPGARAREAGDDVATNPSDAPTLGDVVAARYGRRDLLKGLLGVAAISATVSPLALAAARRAEAADELARFPFPELTAAPDETIHVAEGHQAQVLISWGDPVLPGAPAFDPKAQSAQAQAQQFGYNNDFVGFIPLDGPDHGLLVVNHEYTNEELMFPGLGNQTAKNGFAGMTRELVDIEMAAHGGSVIEIRRGAAGWQVVPGSKYARRITAETPIVLTGPAAGTEKLRTSADPGGRNVKGMLNNCAGGVTPWGTWLTCEENFNYYFSGKREGLPEPAVRVEEDGAISFALQCRHCEDAPCLAACIAGAMTRDPQTGAVKHDEEKCVGCWSCIMVCPFGAIRTNMETHKVGSKCDLCAGKETPACVAHCPNEALVYE